MHAVVFTKAGGREVLQLANLPVPVPGPGEVLVKMTSCGLNRADLLFPQCRYFTKPAFRQSPLATSATDKADTLTGYSQLGFEGAGIIVDTAADLEHLTGQRVGLVQLSNASTHGCLAEYASFPAKSLLYTPASVTDDAAGAIWIQYLTAWGGLVSDGNLQAGQTVVITAASSSVGIASIQIAKMLKARVIATTTSDDKINQLEFTGADLVVNTRQSDYVDAVKQFTNGHGSDLVFDAVAGPNIRHLIQGSAKGGKVIIQGMLDRRPMDIHAGVLMKRLLTLKGFTTDLLFNSDSLMQQAVDGITEGLNNGSLTPVIAGIFPLSDFQNAFELLESNRHLGKIVIKP